MEGARQVHARTQDEQLEAWRRHVEAERLG